MSKLWSKSFEEYALKLVDDVVVPGLAVGLCRDGKLIYNQQFGFRDEEEKLEISMDTVFGIGSVTKSFTCVAIMQLQEAGNLSVHDPVVKYLPEFRMPKGKYTDQVTIHHFMTHTAGLPPLPSLMGAMKRSLENDVEMKDSEKFADLQNMKPIDTYEELMDCIASQDVELLGPPGTEFSYCNDGYALLGTIIERVSGKSYEQHVTEHILQPAGMTRSVFTAEELGQMDDVAKIYTRKPEDLKEVFSSPLWWEAPAMTAAGFLKSTIRDLLRYNEIFRTGGMVGDTRILTAESVKQMITPHVQFSPGKFYGYGLMIVPGFYGGTLVEHGGSIKGVSAQIFIVPEKEITGAALTNVDGVPIPEIMLGSLNALENRAPETPLFTYSDYEILPERLTDFAGEYKSGEGMLASVGLVEDQFALSFQGMTFPLRPVAKDRFAYKRRDTESLAHFIRDEEGNVIRMTFGFRQLPKVNSSEKLEEAVAKGEVRE